MNLFKRPFFFFLIFSFSAFASTNPVIKNKDLRRGFINNKDVVFRLPNIFEVSGSVFDEARNCIWSIGDSANSPTDPKRLRIARSTPYGKTHKFFHIAGATNIDWEAIDLDSKGNLWILDIGDNQYKRKFVTVYQISAQQIDENKSWGNFSIDKKINIYYPNGAMDAEGGFIKGETLYLIQKNKATKQWIVSVNLASKKPAQLALPFRTLRNMRFVTDAKLENENLYILTYYGIFIFNDIFDGKFRFGGSYVLRFWGQVESLVKMPYGPYSFLVGHEDGRFFKVE